MRKSITLLIITSFVFFNFNVKTASADMWGTTIGAELMGQAWEMMQDQIKGVALSSLKQKGIEALTKKLNAKAGSYLITDYNSYLSSAVNTDVNTFTKDYYETIADRDKSNPGGYIEKATATTRKAIQNDLSSGIEGANIESVFRGVNIDGNLFNEKVGGGIAAVPLILETKNNKYGRFMKESKKINNTKEVMKEARKTEAMGNDGYTGDGKASGSVYSEMVKRGATAKQDLLANATNMSELSGLLSMEMDSLSESEYEGEDANDAMQGLLKKLAKGAAVGLLTGGLAPGLDQYIGFSL
ncbi:MAG: hypothetical protein PF549_00765 [Patescibacteria group bacterium]|jgi:hypothetical protein|nr:hypothetical protein [Patescibacteria group bacterium]